MTRHSTQWPIPSLVVNIQNCRPDNGSSFRRPYPVATASASMRRTMLTNNGRVRWLSASISQ